VWYRGPTMRGLMVTMTLVCLTAGCIYLEDLNYAPEVTLTPAVEGPYYRGAPIALSADATDRNSGDVDDLTLTWELTDDQGAALPADAAWPCEPEAAGCFVPRRLDVTYRMTVTVTDPRGARSAAHRDFVVENRGPTAALEASGRRTAAGHYPLYGQIRFSAAQSGDPDAADDCQLTYVYETISRPLGSVTGVFQEGACANGDARAGCGGEAPAWCVRPDAPGTYRMRVTVSDPAGASDTAEASVEVDADGPPCLAQFVPLPIERLFVARSDGTRSFSVNVADDLDPWPAAATNLAGYPAFTWSLQAAADPAPVLIPDYESNHYELDLLAFSAGETVKVRVDVRDRVDRSQTSPCDPAAAICPAGSNPLDPEACVQRLTWTLEVY